MTEPIRPNCFVEPHMIDPEAGLLAEKIKPDFIKSENVFLQFLQIAKTNYGM